MTTTTGPTHATPPLKRRSTAPITAAVALCLVSAGVAFAIIQRERATRENEATAELNAPFATPLPVLTARSPTDQAPARAPTERDFEARVAEPVTTPPVAAAPTAPVAAAPTAPVGTTPMGAAAIPAAPDAGAPMADAPAAAAIATGAPLASASANASVAPPVAVPASGETCGNNVCGPGLVCCNASCGTCTPPGEKCSQLVCGMPVVPGSVACGPSTCNVGELCCNSSCGTCTKPGESCDSARRCGSEIQYPESQLCGMQTCNVGLVCCNPSCGICAPAGEPCTQKTCG